MISESTVEVIKRVREALPDIERALPVGLKARIGYDASKYDDRSIYKMSAVGLNWQAKWSDIYSTRLQYTQSRDFYQTKPSPYETDTRLHSYLFHNEWRLGVQTVTVALERREDKLINSGLDIGSRERSQNALALGYGLNLGKHTLPRNIHDRKLHTS